MANRIIPVAGKDKVLPEEYLPGLRLKERHSGMSFGKYMRENSIYNGLMLFLFVVQFLLFKAFYPYPDFFSDSYSYLYAAYARLDANIWPIGYSKFLWLFHACTHSHLALNFFQYLFLEVSGLYLYHTLVYWFPTGKNTRTVLCVFLFFNPLSLYLANYVSSDALFVGMSLVWLAELVWIVQRPNVWHLLGQAVVFGVAFTFRYNAMYYPLLAGLAFLLSRQRVYMKVAGVLLGPLLMVLFIGFCRNATHRMLGSSQFPPILGGWQWANNALYMREYIDPDTTRFPTPETAELDRIARTYFREVPPEQRDLLPYVANFFIRQPEAPLKQYMVKHCTIEGYGSEVRAWGKVSPVFGEYGTWLIRRYPWAFCRYYMLLNTKNYLFPPLEKLEMYNLGDDSMRPIAGFWFDHPELRVKSPSKGLQGYLLLVYPSLFAVLNLYFLWSLFSFVRLGGFRKTDRRTVYVLGLVVAFVALNFGFSVFANIIVIRYQVFPMLVLLAFSLLLVDQVDVLQEALEKGQVAVASPVPSSAGTEPGMA